MSWKKIHDFIQGLPHSGEKGFEGLLAKINSDNAAIIKGTMFQEVQSLEKIMGS